LTKLAIAKKLAMPRPDGKNYPRIFTAGSRSGGIEKITFKKTNFLWD